MLKLAGRIIGTLLKIVMWIAVASLAYVLFNYITCPVYDFPDPSPFKGEMIYNPYQDADTFFWRRGNFQIQSRAWMGITGGSGNYNEAIDSTYRKLGYEIITISDYMRINRYGEGSPEYIPVYEHGYGLRKWHQVVIGAERVTWRDYPLFQTIHHKQHMINVLKSVNDLVYIAHPRLRGGWSADDFSKLTGYDGIEVLNYMRFSIDHWDAALSAGRYVTAIGNDDAHDISQLLEVGHRCTYIHAEVLERQEVINSLDKGLSYSADIFRTADETWEEKIEFAKKIARVSSVRVTGDTLRVETDMNALEFRFIGQMGEIRKRQQGGSTCEYVFQPEDSYIRIEITFPDRNILYLNPVVRYDGATVGINSVATVNTFRSWVFWIVSWTLTVSLVLLIVRRIRNKRSRGRPV